MNFELTGIIKQLSDPQTFDSGFIKREFVLAVEDGKYTQDIALEAIQTHVGMLEPCSEGQQIRVKFNIRGREYNGRYFNNLQIWDLVHVGDGIPPIKQEYQSKAEPQPQPEPAKDDEHDDLPFL